MKFLVIEGLDGSGKSTQVAMLREYLEDRRIAYQYLHFPRTEAPFFGELVARFLRGELGEIDQVSPWLVAMIYAGDRKDAAIGIENWLKDGKLVLADRYTWSNIAYQCAKVKDETESENLASWIHKLEFEHFAIPRPDLSIYLDVPFDFVRKNLTGNRTGLDRSYLEGNRDIHEEDLHFQQRVHEAYLRQTRDGADLERLTCMNDEMEMMKPEEIFQSILRLCKMRKIF